MYADWVQERMDEHNEYVKNVTPPEKFHMMELKEGWEPLCRILNLPVPDEPFPRVNDADAVEGVNKKIMREAGSRWALILAATGILGYGSLWLWRSGILGRR